MGDLPKSRLLRFVERAMGLARRTVARFSTRYSRERFTLRQHVVLLCLKVKKTTTYRDLVDDLVEMPRIRDAIDLDSIPASSTPWKAFDRSEMAVWRVLFNVSLSIQQLKTTLLVDTATNAVLDIHVTTTRKHDTQIAPQVYTQT